MYVIRLCRIYAKFKTLQDKDARFCDPVHLVKRSYNTLKKICIPRDVNNSHMLLPINVRSLILLTLMRG